MEPFGRPLLTFLAHHIDPKLPLSPATISPLLPIALLIWQAILTHNRGLPFIYILDRLPRAHTPVFVDASISVGLGGACGFDYYLMTHAHLVPYITHCPGWESYPQVQIAWIELLAVFLALYLFGPYNPIHLPNCSLLTLTAPTWWYSWALVVLLMPLYVH